MPRLIKNKLPVKWLMPWAIVHIPIDSEPSSYYGIGETERFKNCFVSTGVSSSQGTLPKWSDLLTSVDAVIGQITGVGKRGNQVTVYCHGLFRVLSLLGVWEGLESGTWTYRDDESDKLALDLGCPKSRHEGIAILSNPPSVLKIRHKPTGRWVTWIDLGNYGFDSRSGLLGTVDNRCTPDCASDCEEHGLIMDEYDEFLSIQSQVTSLLSICSELGNFEPPWTIGSLAWGIYTSGRVTEELSITTSEQERSFQREAIFGGRCEAFYTGFAETQDFRAAGGQVDCSPDSPRMLTSDLNYVDINSCYGSIMADGSLPIGLDTSKDAWAGFSRDNCDDAVQWLAKVEVITDEPAFPVRLEQGTVYPTGRYITTLCGPELVEGIRLGYVRSVIDSRRFVMGKPFARVSELLMKRRSKAKEHGENQLSSLLKMALNSFAGLWGRKSNRWQPVKNEHCPHAWGEWLHHNFTSNTLTRRRAIAGALEELSITDTHKDSFPAVLGWIQSYARLKLLNLIRLSGWDNVLYCDTDGLIVTQEGLLRLCSDASLWSQSPGGLSVRESYKWVDVYGPKRYITDLGYSVSGVPQWGTTRDKSGWNWRSTSTVQSSLTVDRGREVRWIDRHHTLERVNTSRVSTRDGWSVPYHLGEPLEERKEV